VRVRVGVRVRIGARELLDEDRGEGSHVVEHELVGVDVAVDFDVVIVHDDVARGSEPLLGRAEPVARLPAGCAGSKVGVGLGRLASRLGWGVAGGGLGGVAGRARGLRAGRVYSTGAGGRRVHDTHPLEIVRLDRGIAAQGQQVLVVGEEARDERVAAARHHHVRRVLRVLNLPHLGHGYSAGK